MADKTWLEGNFSNPYGDPDPYRDGKSAGDFGLALGAGAAGSISNLGALVRSIGESSADPESRASKAISLFGEITQAYFGGLEGDALESMSPAAQRDLQATFSDPAFWSLGSLALKTANMAPDVAVAVIPSVLVPGYAAALAGSIATGGVLSAASVTDELYETTDTLNDKELQEQVAMYRQLRANGVPEEQARAEFNKEFRGMRPVIAGMFGAVTNALGPAGQAARAVGGVGGSVLAHAGEGVLKRAGKGAAEGAISEGFQEGLEDYVVQDAQAGAGFREGIDLSQLGNAVGTGAVMGGVLGGGISAVSPGGGRQNAEVDVALGVNKAPATDAPNMPTTATPPEMPAPVTANGGTANPGVSDAVATGATIAQEMQARKNTGADYASLTPEQRAEIDGKLASRGQPVAGVTIVEGAAPDAAQTVALEGVKAKPEVVTPEVTVPEAVAQPPVQEAPRPEAPMEQPAAPVEQAQVQPQQPPVVPQEPVAVQQPPIEQPIAEAPVRPTEAVSRPTGPRVLDDLTAPDYTAETAAQVSKNITAMETPEQVAKGRNRDKAERAERAATRDGAAAIAEKYQPAEQEAGLLSKRPADVVTARKLMLDRAQAISEEANKMGLKLPTAFRDSTRADDNYNPETLLVMEARKLATKKNPKQADYERFMNRELDVRTGSIEQAVADRRAEGDAANRQAGDIDASELPDTHAPADAANPETQLIAAEEARAAAAEETGVETKRTPVKVNSEKIPASVEKALGEALYTVPKTDRKAPVIEAKKKRVLNKPAAVEAKPEARAKVVDLAERIRLKRAETAAKSEPMSAPVTPEVKVAPKLAAVKERIEQARKNTNTNPTPAQAIAGNYKKGKVSIHGVSVVIENPKGSTRSNKNPEGPAWSVKMKNDYGYIEGTKGADGDPIDVYLGPDHDSSYVYVIDQLDNRTQDFDEHKVMMGFKSEQDVFNAYDRAFSDGQGMLRIGDVRKMTMAEFKEWAASKPEDRAGMSTEQAIEARSMMIDDEIISAIEQQTIFADGIPDGYVRDPISGEVAKHNGEHTASELMWGLDLSNMNGAARVIAGTARNVLTKLVGDTKVYYVSAENIKRLMGSGQQPLGYHVLKGKNEAIFLDESLKNDPDKLRHVVLHEVTHAATVRAIMTSPSINHNINALSGYVAAELRKLSPEEIKSAHYAFTNSREFVAEAFSNPEFQQLLSRLPVPPHVIEALKLDVPVATMWDALIHAVRRALGLPKNTATMLDAAMRVTEMAMRPRTMEMEAQSFLKDGSTSALIGAMKESLKSINERADLAPTKGNPHLLGFRTFDNIARAADRYFKGNNPIRKVANIIERQRTAAVENIEKAAPTIKKLYDLQNKYRGVTGIDGHSVWDNFATLVHDETMANVYADRPLADQKHLSKEGARDSWRRAQYPELSRVFESLPADIREARKEAMEFFTNRQNEIAQKNIRNRIKQLFDVPDPEGLADRIHEGKETEADKAALGDAYDAIKEAGVFSKIDGPYFPLMRRGNYVVNARRAIAAPKNAEVLGEGDYQFKTKDEAASFAEKQDGRPTMTTVYVDKNTGLTTGTDNGRTVRLTANDMDAEPRYRVRVQQQHTEMFDTMKQARDRVVELRKIGFNVDDASPRNFENFGTKSDALSVHMRKLDSVLERRADERNLTPEQKAEMRATMNEAALSLLGSTRIQSRSLPRQYVAGASKDLVRNITDYSHATGNYIAKLDYRPQLDIALTEMMDASKATRDDGLTAGRTAIQNEVLRRVSTVNPASENTKWNSLTSRVLAISFIDKLMSPAYSVINATQPMMITAPYLAGQFGPGRAYSAMAKAYNDIGSMKVIKAGLADTMAKFNANNTDISSDPVEMIKNRLKNPREIEMINILAERGTIEAGNGLEVAKFTKSTHGIGGRIDTGIGYLEGIARQMPKAIEAANRTVSALAAYRLEFERSGNHDLAVQFAQDTVNLTQFNYSASNSAPYMNHPVLRLAMQFKKYGIGMYQFLGEQVAMAVHNTNPGDRARAIKSLSYTIGMHVLIAGAMGLPTEPIKLIVTAANGLGLTDWSWGDIENAQREAAAQLFGKEFGEVLSRGVSRFAGVDLASRMGIDTLMGPFGEPRSNEAQDWKAYVWDAVSGAPAGLVADWAKGVNSLAAGDIPRAMERLVPIKAFSDGMKAYRTMTEGNVSERTGRQTMSPYSLGEAALRTFGFSPAREAESFERSSAFYAGRDKMKDARTQFQREWAESNGAGRGRVWREVQKYNKTQPAEARLTLSELRNYEKRVKADIQKTKDGLRAKKREQELLKRTSNTFNY